LELFLQAVIDGLLIGGVYITIAIGFSLAFGVMHIIDFAVGEWVMLGAYIAWVLQQSFGVDPLLFLPALMVVFFAAGWLLHPALHRVTSGRRPMPVLMGLLFTFGVATTMKGAAIFIWGHDVRSLRTVFTGSFIDVMTAVVPTVRLFAFFFGVVVTVLCMLFLYKTKTGMAIRAVAQDRVTASILGVDLKRISALVYGLYAGITGMAGLVIGTLFTIQAEMGMRYTTFAFFTVVLAGLGYLPGVIPAALLLGLIQSLVAIYLGGAYNLLILFAVLYIVLLTKPKGLLGRGW